MHHQGVILPVRRWQGLSAGSALREIEKTGLTIGPVSKEIIRKNSCRVPSLQSAELRFVAPQDLGYETRVSYKDLVGRAEAHNLYLCPPWVHLVTSLEYELKVDQVVVMATKAVLHDHNPRLYQLSYRWGVRRLEVTPLCPDYPLDEVFAFWVKGEH